MANGTTAGAKVTKSGTVTITLDLKKDYTAADIQKLLADVTTASGSNAASTEVLDAVKKATVTGTGITKVTGTTATGLSTAGVRATSTGAALTLQIGDTSDDYNQLAVEVQDMHIATLGLTDASIANQTSAQNAVDMIKKAINTVSSVRGDLGATQNRLDHTINNLSVMEENIQGC